MATRPAPLNDHQTDNLSHPGDDPGPSPEAGEIEFSLRVRSRECLAALGQSGFWLWAHRSFQRERAGS